MRVQRVGKEDLASDRSGVGALLGEREHRGGAIIAVNRDLLVDECPRRAEEPAPLIAERHEMNLARDVSDDLFNRVRLDESDGHRVVVGDAGDPPCPRLGLDVGDLQLAGFTFRKVALVPTHDRRSRHDGKRVRMHALVKRIEISFRFEHGELARGVGRLGQPVIGLCGDAAHWRSADAQQTSARAARSDNR